MATELGTMTHTRGGVRTIESLEIHTAENGQIRLLFGEPARHGTWEVLLPQNLFLETLGAALAPRGTPPPARCTEHTYEPHPNVPGLRRCATCFRYEIPQGRRSR